MEQFKAERFFLTGQLLQQMDSTLVTTSSINKKFSLETMNHILAECKSVGLRISCNAIEKVIRNLKDEPLDVGAVKQDCQTVRDVIAWEMKDTTFMYIPHQRAELYDQPELFGMDVNAKFPAIQFDMVEAGNCYASGRSTAVVFHLMRIMEIGVQQFGTKLGVTLATEKNWQNILDEINKAIKALAKSPATVEMSQASANLYAIKLAWRNEVMHPKDTYTMEEADNLIKQVRIFMQQLAKII